MHPRPRALPKHRLESLPIRADPPLLDDLPGFPRDADLAVHLVHVVAYTLHSWPLLLAALTARLIVELFSYHVGAGPSRFIPIYSLAVRFTGASKTVLNPDCITMHAAVCPLRVCSAGIRP
jgi:hypothetical protein